jgi:DNA-binding response OmpR family regulator
MRVAPRALLVEADPTLRRQLLRALEAGGFTVEEARDGSAAVAAVSMSTPDVIVFDLGMSDLPPLDVLGAVRRRSGAPVVLVAGPDEEDDRSVAMELGAGGAVAKPVCDAELLDEVRRAIALTR